MKLLLIILINSDENPISVSKVYKKVLDNIFEFLINPDYEVAFTWNKLIENTDFIKSFIESYHPKALGDFLQELNAILKFGGYTFTNPIYKRGTDIEQFGNAKRLFLSGDQVSAVRYIYLKKILEDKYKNLLSRGGYGYKTNSTDIFII